MARKIIKEGRNDFIAECDVCGCEFSYQLTDITLNSVVCPTCGHYIVHKLNKLRLEDGDDKTH